VVFVWLLVWAVALYDRSGVPSMAVFDASPWRYESLLPTAAGATSHFCQQQQKIARSDFSQALVFARSPKGESRDGRIKVTKSAVRGLLRPAGSCGIF